MSDRPDLGRRHTAEFDRRSIEAHYDVSNEFYATFLDRNMVYTCAYFEDLASDDIDAAQEAKLEHVCRKLRIRPGDRFLDIGCGWGALVRHAARRHGARAYGVTLSPAQAEYAQKRIRDEGLADLARVELRDARTLDPSRERFDRIAAVGVLEHIGPRHYDEFFRMVRGLLADDGVFLNHSITNRPGTRPDGSSEFLFSIIFPNGELTHLSHVLDRMERAGFEVADVEDLRWHYERTCTLWTRRLQAARAEALRFVSERTYRLWLLYLAGSATSFADGWSLLYQTVAVPHRDVRSPLPATRADLYAHALGKPAGEDRPAASRAGRGAEDGRPGLV